MLGFDARFNHERNEALEAGRKTRTSRETIDNVVLSRRGNGYGDPPGFYFSHCGYPRRVFKLTVKGNTSHRLRVVDNTLSIPERAFRTRSREIMRVFANVNVRWNRKKRKEKRRIERGTNDEWCRVANASHLDDSSRVQTANNLFDAACNFRRVHREPTEHSHGCVTASNTFISNSVNVSTTVVFTNSVNVYTALLFYNLINAYTRFVARTRNDYLTRIPCQISSAPKYRLC